MIRCKSTCTGIMHPQIRYWYDLKNEEDHSDFAFWCKLSRQSSSYIAFYSVISIKTVMRKQVEEMVRVYHD